MTSDTKSERIPALKNKNSIILYIIVEEEKLSSNHGEY